MTPSPSRDRSPGEPELPESLLWAVLNSPSVAIVVAGEDGRIKLVNQTVEGMFGYSSAELSAQPVELLIPERLRTVHARHRANYFASPRNRLMGLGIDLAAMRKDGTEFPVEVSLSHVQTAEGMLTVAFVSDISVRRQTEEERDNFFNISLDPMCIRDRNGNFRHVNPAMMALLGRSEAELCSTPFLDFVHPEDRDRTMAAILGVFEGRPMVAFENRDRAGDGTWRWLQWTAVAPSPTASHYYAAARDVTAAKLTQEKLRDLAGKVMVAQEDERRRVARELHDDFTQRLASLGIELGLLKQGFSAAEARGLHEELNRLQAQILHLTEHVRQLSHSLHPSFLEHSDLGGLLEMHCRDFTIQHGIAASVRVRALPEDVPRPIVLALYRIAQESLRNVAQHSTAKEVSVTIAGEDGCRLSMFIIDNGKGFDVHRVKASPGLGLVSMEERARGIRASLAIDSMPDEGTRISVQVPLIKDEGQ